MLLTLLTLTYGDAEIDAEPYPEYGYTTTVISVPAVALLVESDLEQLLKLPSVIDHCLDAVLLAKQDFNVYTYSFL